MTKELLVGFIVGAVIGIIISLIIKLRSMIIELRETVDENQVEHQKIIDRLPSKVIVDEGSITGYQEYVRYGVSAIPIRPRQISFYPINTKIYDLNDFNGEVYDNIVKLQVVQEKDLKENHRYYRVTCIKGLTKDVEYYYIGAPQEPKVQTKTRVKKDTVEETKTEKGE